MRRFLIDTRNQCAPGGGSHGTERNSSDNEAQRVPDQPETQPILEPQEIRAETQVNLEPRELPDHPELQTNLGNYVAEFNPNEILCDPALGSKYMNMLLKFKTKLGEHIFRWVRHNQLI